MRRRIETKITQKLLSNLSIRPNAPIVSELMIVAKSISFLCPTFVMILPAISAKTIDPIAKLAKMIPIIVDEISFF